MLIIGSYALTRNLAKCNDIDVIAPSIDNVMCWITQNANIIIQHYWITDFKYIAHALIENRQIVIEFEIAAVGNSSFNLLSDARSYDPFQQDVYGLGYFATKEVCLMLKLSHRFLRNSPFFWKTMKDIALLNAVTPHGLSDWLLPILKKREFETYTYLHPKLNVNKDAFFQDDNIIYTYDHDELHEVVKLYDKPAYQYFKPIENEVYCSADLFNATDDNIKLAAVYEESCVLALERSLIPFNAKLSYEDAFILALSKVCTSITSGWFREYAYNNAYRAIELLAAQNTNFYSLFLLALRANKIQPIKEKL